MSSITDKFEKACDYVNSQHSKLNQKVLVRLYGYFKQATLGNCNAPKPSVFDFGSHAKWKSWSKLGCMSKTEAMLGYIQTLSEAAENWNTEDHNTEKITKENSWISVSTLRGEAELPESAKDVFDWVKEGDLTRLKHCDVSCTNLRDEQGLSLLHWAADRGHIDTVKYLIENLKFDVNCRDAEEQTPLHYAAACGHTEICKLLIRYGADMNAIDNDGKTPKNVAELPIIIDLLSVTADIF